MTILEIVLHFANIWGRDWWMCWRFVSQANIDIQNKGWRSKFLLLTLNLIFSINICSNFNFNSLRISEIVLKLNFEQILMEKISFKVRRRNLLRHLLYRLHGVFEKRGTWFGLFGSFGRFDVFIVMIKN